ncbi:MAG: hydroxyisourate hydrolase [Steroidobacterales bacterium]
MGSLTTHVLDLVSGQPAAGMAIELAAVEGGVRRMIVKTTTNPNGRCDGALLDGDRFTAGVWQLEFHVAKYFAAKGVPLAKPPFLDIVTVRFGVANPGEHHHVPLLVTPWSYSTYRGS